MVLLKKKNDNTFKVSCIGHLQTDFFQSWYGDNAKFYILIPLWMMLTLIQSHNCIGRQKHPSLPPIPPPPPPLRFPQIFQSSWMKFSKLPQYVNTGLHPDVYEPISFWLKSTVWHQLEWTWRSLKFTGLLESLNLCSHSVMDSRK